LALSVLCTTSSASTGAEETVNEVNKEARDPLDGATCSASSFAWGNDKPFNDVWNRLSTNGVDPIGDQMIKDGMEAVWHEKGTKTYEAPPVVS
jgi:hypothetical protein